MASKLAFRTGSFVLTALLIVGGCVEACGGDDDSDIPSPAASSTGTQAQGTVGSAGGSVTTSTGVGVMIPAGALPNNVQVTVKTDVPSPPPAGATAVGTRYIFGPSGLQFAKPVTVVLDFDATKLPAGKTVNDIVVFTAPDGSTNFTQLTTRAHDATHVEADTTHFSVFVAGVATGGTFGGGGGDAAPDPDAGGNPCVAHLCGYYGPGTCGSQADGCGSTLDCGTCPTNGDDAGTDAGANDAGGADNDGGSCNALTCANYETSAGHPICETHDDGCGGTLTCTSGCEGGAPDGGSTDASSGSDADLDGGTSSGDDGGMSDASTSGDDGGDASSGLDGGTSSDAGSDASTGSDAGDDGGDASASACGNSVLDSGETCDDGNATSSDGCSSSCQVEPSYQCTGAGPGSCIQLL